MTCGIAGEGEEGKEGREIWFCLHGAKQLQQQKKQSKGRGEQATTTPAKAPRRVQATVHR